MIINKGQKKEVTEYAKYAKNRKENNGQVNSKHGSGWASTFTKGTDWWLKCILQLLPLFLTNESSRCWERCSVLWNEPLLWEYQMTRFSGWYISDLHDTIEHMLSVSIILMHLPVCKLCWVLSAEWELVIKECVIKPPHPPSHSASGRGWTGIITTISGSSVKTGTRGLGSATLILYHWCLICINSMSLLF